jgi:hypothetical protein
MEKIKGAKVVSLFFEENKSEDNEFLEVVKTKGGSSTNFSPWLADFYPKFGSFLLSMVAYFNQVFFSSNFVRSVGWPSFAKDLAKFGY